MQLEDLIKRAIEIRQKYDDLNKVKGRAAWTERDFMAGFVGDVGDLSKIIMAKNGLRVVNEVDAKLAHELVDCLWSVLILADKYKIDLSSEFVKNMDELEKRISAGE